MSNLEKDEFAIGECMYAIEGILEFAHGLRHIDDLVRDGKTLDLPYQTLTGAP